jgi:hypothetical protein
MPGGSLMSKPTWSKAFGFSATSAFFMTFGGNGPPPSPWMVAGFYVRTEFY